MPSKKTVVIIGAGASAEVDLPTGFQLKDKIANLLNFTFSGGPRPSNGDLCIYQAIKRHVESRMIDLNEVNDHLRAAKHIKRALPQAISIDNFIDSHNGDVCIEFVAKLSIARSILMAEQRSKLYIDRESAITGQIKFRELESTWYGSFFKLLFENCRKSNIINRLESIVFIVFNYDRCLEQFLIHALNNYYDLDAQEIEEVRSVLEIYHPYGSVGKLTHPSDKDFAAFGDEPDPIKLINIARQIKTFTEGLDEVSSQISAIRENLFIADRAIFLGFAFHPLNMDLLLPVAAPENVNSDLLVFGTTKGMSEYDCEAVKENLHDRLIKIGISPTFELKNLTCADFFNEYWRGLSFV